MAGWHPRKLVTATEWLVAVPGQPEPIAVIRRLRIGGRVIYRAVTWAPSSSARELVGYYPNGDEAAVAVWRRYVAAHRTRHEAASRTHGGRERG